MGKILGLAGMLVLVVIVVQVYASGTWKPYVNRFAGLESFGVPVLIHDKTRVLMEDNQTGIYLFATDSGMSADITVTFNCAGGCMFRPTSYDLHLLTNKPQTLRGRSFELKSSTANSAVLVVTTNP
jgi:hypothetical protein